MHLYLSITLLVFTGQSASNYLDMLRESCPYSNFCNINSLKVFNKTNDTMPCCYNCLCDEHCSMFGDCCPDYEPSIPKPDVAALDCKPAHIATDRTLRELVIQHIIIDSEIQKQYRMIDFCPTEYLGDINVIEKCNGTFEQLPNLDDLVLVSDKGGRIFKNKYCAACHSVFDVTRWLLKVVACVDDLSKVQLTLSEAQFFIINYCVVTSERPRGIHVTPRMMECPQSLHCDNTTNELFDACYNGPYMPYLSSTRSSVLYKNVFCFEMCSGPREDDGICPNFDSIQSRFFFKSYQILLDLSKAEKPRDPTSTGCSEAELVNKYTGSCRRVYCPPFEVISYGRCVPLSSGVINLFVKVQVFYTLIDGDVNITATPHVNYNETTRNYFLRKIYKKFGYSKCKIVQLLLYAQIEMIFKRFERFLLIMTYEINDECTLKKLGDRIKYTTFPEKETWLFQDRFLDMVGRYTFYEDPPLDLDQTYENELLIFEASRIFLTSSIQRFFLCPYFKYSFKEYKDHVIRSDIMSEEYKLKGISPSSRYLDGFYPIAQNEIVVCVDVDQAAGRADVIYTINVCMILIVVVNFFT